MCVSWLFDGKRIEAEKENSQPGFAEQSNAI
jgi:hypothetical protein